jgi:hypothetical protein
MIATLEHWASIADFMILNGVQDRNVHQCSTRWTLLSKLWKKIQNNQLHSIGNVDYWCMIGIEHQAAKLPSSYSISLFEGIKHILGKRACNMPKATSSSMQVRFSVLIVNFFHICIKK